MKTLVLYNRHEAGQETKARLMVESLGAMASAVDLVNVYGGTVGRAIRDLLGPREFPCVIFVQDHLQGPTIADASYLEAVVAEQQDIESREFRKETPNHLAAQLEQAREEVRQMVRAAAAKEPLDTSKLEQLFAAESERTE